MIIFKRNYLECTTGRSFKFYSSFVEFDEKGWIFEVVEYGRIGKNPVRTIKNTVDLAELILLSNNLEIMKLIKQSIANVDKIAGDKLNQRKGYNEITSKSIVFGNIQKLVNNLTNMPSETTSQLPDNQVDVEYIPAIILNRSGNIITVGEPSTMKILGQFNVSNRPELSILDNVRVALSDSGLVLGR